MKVSIRPATPADVLSFTGETPPYRIRAYVGTIDGEIVGVGGLGYLPDGSVAAFLHLDDAARTKAPVALTKIAKRVIREARERGVRVIAATCDPTVPAAPRFLQRLGFVELSEGLYRYEA